MKRIFLLLISLMTVNNVFCDATFIKSQNYQYNNAHAYIGETLIIINLSGTSYEKNVTDKYRGFKDYCFNEDYDLIDNMLLNYKFVINDYRDGTIGGTHKRHLEGRKFLVTDANLIDDYKTIWALHLYDIYTGERLKFIYHGADKYGDEFQQFPFVVEKHLNYCKSLIGTKAVFATNTIPLNLYEHLDSYKFSNDIYTGNTIKYDKTYAKWTIKDAIIDHEEYQCVALIVSNGKNTIKITYQFPFIENHPKYNAGIRVFTEQQWDKLVNEYGEYNMSLIMNTQKTDDMTLFEKRLAGGRRFEQRNTPNDFKGLIHFLGNNVINSFIHTYIEFKDNINVLF